MFKYKIPIPLVRFIFILKKFRQKGTVAFNAKEAYFIAKKFGEDYKKKYVVKAQVLLI